MIREAVTVPARIEAAIRRIFRPMDADQRDVDAAGDQRLDRRVGRWLGEAVEPPALQVRDPWRELEAQQREKSKNMLGITAAIGVVAADGDLALVIEQSVKDMQGFARRRPKSWPPAGAARLP